MTYNKTILTNKKNVIVFKAPQDPRRVTVISERLKISFPFYKISGEGTEGKGAKATGEVSSRAVTTTIFPMFIEAE